MSATDSRYSTLLNALAARKQRVYDYLFASDYARRFAPQHIRDAAFLYLQHSGKSLRPSVLMLACGAVGGDENVAIPAAAGIEVYHTWTLVHDDVIDRDDKRRGAPTVHVEFARRGAKELGFEGAEAEHYGRVIAILTGDVQQSWAYMLFHELYNKHGVDPALVLRLEGRLATDVQLTLVEGETLDVQFEQRDVFALSQEEVVGMLHKKTGFLYEFAGWAGATIGLNDAAGTSPLVEKIGRFCGQCGTAFQLQDDVLGVVGSTAQTGKPVGADLREGKKTLIVYYALRHASDAQKRDLLSVLGHHAATDADIARATGILSDLGAIEYTRQEAARMVHEAETYLDELPPSPYSDLLCQWAEYLIDRNL